MCEVSRSKAHCQQPQLEQEQGACNGSCVYEVVPQNMLTDEARSSSALEYGRLRRLANCNADSEAAARSILFGSKMKHLVSSILCGQGRSDGDQLMLFNEQYIVKPSRSGDSGSFAWHRDADSLFSAREGQSSILLGENHDSIMIQYVSVWIALDGTTAANGCLRIRPKSHVIGHGETVSTATVARENATSIVELEVDAGTAIVMHHMVEHCSGPNMTQFERRAWMPQYSCRSIPGASYKRPVSLAIPVLW